MLVTCCSPKAASSSAKLAKRDSRTISRRSCGVSRMPKSSFTDIPTIAGQTRAAATGCSRQLRAVDTPRGDGGELPGVAGRQLQCYSGQRLRQHRTSLPQPIDGYHGTGRLTPCRGGEVNLWTVGCADPRLTAPARSPMDQPGKTPCVSPALPTARRLPTSFTAPARPDEFDFGERSNHQPATGL